MKKFLSILLISAIGFSTSIQGASPDLGKSSKIEKITSENLAKSINSLSVNYQIVEFDTQDNLVKIGCNQWEQSINLDNLTILQDYGIWRNGNKTIWFKSKIPIKWITINNFPYGYEVKKINSQYFQIKCSQFQKYWDSTDNITIAVRK